MIVSALRPQVTLGEVQLKAFGKPNALAIYTVVILLFLNLLYGEGAVSKLPATACLPPTICCCKRSSRLTGFIRQS